MRILVIDRTVGKFYFNPEKREGVAVDHLDPVLIRLWPDWNPYSYKNVRVVDVAPEGYEQLARAGEAHDSEAAKKAVAKYFKE